LRTDNKDETADSCTTNIPLLFSRRTRYL
jgi:hypothetical protein